MTDSDAYEIVTQGLEHSSEIASICVCSFLSTAPAHTHLISVQNVNTFNVKCSSQLLLARVLGGRQPGNCGACCLRTVDRASARFWEAKERVPCWQVMSCTRKIIQTYPHLLHLYHPAPAPGLWAQVSMMRGCTSLSYTEVNWLWQSCLAAHDHFQHFSMGKRHFQKWITEFWNTTS